MEDGRRQAQLAGIEWGDVKTCVLVGCGKREGSDGPLTIVASLPQFRRDGLRTEKGRRGAAGASLACARLEEALADTRAYSSPRPPSHSSSIIAVATEIE